MSCIFSFYAVDVESLHRGCFAPVESVPITIEVVLILEVGLYVCLCSYQCVLCKGDVFISYRRPYTFRKATLNYYVIIICIAGLSLPHTVLFTYTLCIHSTPSSESVHPSPPSLPVLQPTRPPMCVLPVAIRRCWNANNLATITGHPLAHMPCPTIHIIPHSHT